jgi:glucosamine--fructose-6-phosphate aminotransferase (isomerizing)
MCSIIGIVTNNHAQVAPKLVKSLSRMEYRGYDSVGLATITNTGISVKKGVGKVSQVNGYLNLAGMEGFVGIGHTRWATHGGVTDHNAHPHSCCTNDIAVVHNGIIENYQSLKQELTKTGHTFRSETDTEVIAHLLEQFHHNTGSIKKAMMETVGRIQGSFAFVAMFMDNTLACARLDEPLVIGIADGACYASSDVLGFLEYTDQAIFLDNRDIAIIDSTNGIDIFNFEGEKVVRNPTKVAWELADANKGKFAHYTIKEIFEQRETIRSSVTAQDAFSLKRFCDLLLDARKVIITGSGTSYHTSLIASMVGSRYLKKHFEPVMASEFRYNIDSIDSDTTLVAISQSGETADVLNAVKLAKNAGAKILSIVNVPSSSLARIADVSLCTNCGPEIGVAATKSFTGQLALVYATIDMASGGKIGFDAAAASDAVAGVLQNSLKVEALVKDKMARVNDIYLLGRSLHFPIALEGALKMKELAYIHAEGMPAGELKHGPLALMDKNVYVFVLNPSDKTYTDTLGSVHEVKARGAKLIGISDVSSDLYDAMIKIPKMDSDILYPLLEVIPLQIFSYHLALQNNVDPDFPRNLAKSVTVR